MKYSSFGNTGLSLSRLGFGAMRLPKKKTGEKESVDFEFAAAVMQRSFDLGVNYVDTGPGYCDDQSETAVAMALKGYDNVYLSTKNYMDDDSTEKWMGKLEKSLKVLGRDHIDFYHLWAIDLAAFNEKFYKKGGPMETAARAKEQGLIKHLSFSYHGKPEDIAQVIDSGLFSSMLVQYNLLDRSFEDGIRHARSKGLGVVAMGPVGGGVLGAPSPVIQSLLKEKSQSTAETALRFVLANPNVNMALSGMNTMEMVEENVAVASADTPLTLEELQRVEAMMAEHKKTAELYCTACDYCKPCPQNVEIPRIFKSMNYHRVYGLTGLAKSSYREIRNENNAGACNDCGTCEEKCPQKIEVRRQLKECHGFLSEDM